MNNDLFTEEIFFIFLPFYSQRSEGNFHFDFPLKRREKKTNKLLVSVPLVAYFVEYLFPS